ncbi:TPA: hypothetical protein ACH3X1_008169 [Trebouxia sp. C0004]
MRPKTVKDGSQQDEGGEICAQHFASGALSMAFTHLRHDKLWQVVWQQQPTEAAQIAATVITLTGSLDNRSSLLCRSFAEEGFCSTGSHVAEFVRRQSRVHARFEGGMFYP